MTEEKFIDIVNTMVDIGVLNPAKAMLDNKYFQEQFWSYVNATNTVRKWLNIEPIF